MSLFLYDLMLPWLSLWNCVVCNMTMVMRDYTSYYGSQVEKPTSVCAGLYPPPGSCHSWNWWWIHALYGTLKIYRADWCSSPTHTERTKRKRDWRTYTEMYKGNNARCSMLLPQYYCRNPMSNNYTSEYAISNISCIVCTPPNQQWVGNGWMHGQMTLRCVTGSLADNGSQVFKPRNRTFRPFLLLLP